MKTIYFSLLLAAMFLVACSDKSSGPEVLLPAPKIFPNPPDMSEQEKGIDAVEDMDAFIIEWQPDEQYEGIELYRRAEDEEKYRLLKTFDQPDSFFIDVVADTNVQLNVRYYYYIRAFDEKKHKSEPSDTVDYKLLPKAINLSESMAGKLVFHWSVPDFSFESYVLKLYDITAEEYIWIIRVYTSYQGTDESVSYNNDGNAKISQLTRNQQYRWRIDVVGPSPNSGSESNWKYFIMQ
jgi:hypothetical protein